MAAMSNTMFSRNECIAAKSKPWHLCLKSCIWKKNSIRYNKNSRLIPRYRKLRYGYGQIVANLDIGNLPAVLYIHNIQLSISRNQFFDIGNSFMDIEKWHELLYRRLQCGILGIVFDMEYCWMNIILTPHTWFYNEMTCFLSLLRIN